REIGPVRADGMREYAGIEQERVIAHQDGAAAPRQVFLSLDPDPVDEQIDEPHQGHYQVVEDDERQKGGCESDDIRAFAVRHCLSYWRVRPFQITPWPVLARPKLHHAM